MMTRRPLRRLVTTSVAVAALCLSAHSAMAVVNPAAWFEFNGPSGAPTGGTVVDSSGNNNNGIVINPGTVLYINAGGPVLSGSGGTLNAVDFRGLLDGDAFAILQSASMNFSRNQGSLVLWVNLDVNKTRQTFIKTDQHTGSIGVEIATSGAGGAGAVFGSGGAGNNSDTDPTYPFHIGAGAWNHLVLTWDFVNGAPGCGAGVEYALYRNNSLDGDLAGTTDGCINAGGPFVPPGSTENWWIGEDPIAFAGNRSVDGKMADVGIFPGALTATEVSCIYNFGIANYLNDVCGVQEPGPTPQPQPTGNVPEPGTAGLAMLALTGTALLRRRKH